MFHVGVLLHFNIIVLEISVLKQPGGDLSFGIEMTSCNHENPTNFHAGCVQDFARVEGWILSFEIGNYKGKKTWVRTFTERRWKKKDIRPHRKSTKNGQLHSIN